MDHLFQDNLGLIIQTALILIGLGIAWGSLNNTIKGHGARLTKVEGAIELLGQLRISDASDRERMNAIDSRMLLQGQRIDENMKAMSDRMVEQSRRIDSTITIFNGRLEAINNIVAGHTAQLNAIQMNWKSGQKREGAG